MINQKSFKKAVIFFANAVGDHLIVLPTVRALSHIFNGRISLMALPNAREEIFPDVVFEEAWTINFPGSKNWYSGVPSTSDITFDHEVLALQAKGCDLFLSLTAWHTPEVEKLIALLSPSISMGYFPSFDQVVASEHCHVFDAVFSITHEFDPHIRLENFIAPPPISKKNSLLVKELRAELEKDGRHILIIHADTKKRKMWDHEKFLSVIDAFLMEYPNFLAVIVGLWNFLPIERALNKNRIFNLCGLSIDLSFGLISIGDVFIGIDSCMLHAADLFRVPGVGIFGPTEPKRWGFRFAPHEHIHSEHLELLSEEYVLKALLKLTASVI